MADLVQILFSVSGSVQGPTLIIYRDFTQKAAVRQKLKGWCRNTTCGRVEGEVQGDQAAMKKFLQEIDKGPRMSHVVKVEKKNMEPHEREDSFEVLRTGESMFHSGS
ncbi:hypothetical protein N7448_005091 [Penicillium atrosanguineum]|uniref:acylphosphatase n=1 Tax=Penicillium atrosanguineum TaxID=1132637 RepID=A0A9W9PR35_9EURO|nr:cell wall biogenesis protein [Penicillium atrosanguineum]KAJ5125777.1 hypothetical protein N7526_007954 [Penicillium atrosanguineum]KAJ5136537.1 hypothetical protein N7448_005091 [Penicillium atrosanguineum]KAJ5292869.1 cell wall biogenesis protein [Penicillium atrosanguineum]KAJ5303094.1 hypothetical protein N7476_009893 [Penicillium atrosanguineum]